MPLSGVVVARLSCRGLLPLPLSSVASVCQSSDALQTFLVDAHNRVSLHVNPKRKPWTLADATRHYTNATTCLHNAQWGDQELCREDQCVPWNGTFVPAGFCGTLPTANPRVFGPDTWKALHIMAQFFPDNPNARARDACDAFMHALPYMLACDHCGYHLNETLAAYAGPLCTNHSTLQEFLVHAQNRVSQQVHPSRENWTLAEAEKTYSTATMCLHNTQWGDSELQREAEDA